MSQGFPISDILLCVKPVTINGSVIDRIAPLSLPISP